MIDSMKNGVTAYCLTGNSDTTNAAGSISTEGCAHTTETDSGPGAVAEASAITSEGYANSSGVANGTGKSQQDKCGFFTGTDNQQNNAGFPTSSPAITGVKIINGLFKLNAASDPTTPDLKNVARAVSGGLPSFWQDLNAATKAYFTQPLEQVTEVSKATLIALAKRATVERNIREFLAAANGTSPKSIKGNIDAECKQYIGDPNEKTEQMWAELEAARVVDPEKDDGPTTELKSLTEPRILEGLLAYYEAKVAARQKQKAAKITKLETELADQKGASPETECNKISDEPKCNDKKICSWHTDVKNGEKNIANLNQQKQK
uniref:Variant surface glycoprotein 1125.2816 n=1 Tax=Trypanosoma brucei TaxID=5691 RepID=A0A1J0R8X8_9TRYP|nr:variant surface glycoprotein 1125.2816 [Trypanosoma brucei]